MFDAALDLSPDERMEFVGRVCDGDAELHASVLRLLHAHERAGSFLTQPAAGLAAVLLDGAEPIADTTETPLPERIGPYRIERELGRGGMGVVYLAEREDPEFRQQVALKVMRGDGVDARKLVPRFLAERRILVSLDHPHIARLFDGGVTAEGLPYFTMAYCEGGTLATRLAGGRQLPLPEALLIARQLATALAAAHARGVVHRDVKPANVLFDSAGLVRLSDFGVAKLLDGESSRSEVVLGTPAYLAPEQVWGAAVDHRADLWALGVTLYEMLAGRRPFDGPSYAAVLHAITSAEPEPVSRYAPGVPASVDTLLLRLLRKNPAARPPSADEVEATLAMGRARGRAARRPRVRWAAVALAGAAAAAIFGGGGLRSRPADRPPLDGSLVAVVPFDVFDPALALWREGLVDLLSRNLDGAGPLRTVSPTVVVRRWAGRADPASAGGLGRRTGAGLALYGSLLSAGRDSLRVRATLFDVTGNRAVGEWELGDSAGRVDRLADSLTLGVLRGLGRTRPIGAVRLTGLGSASLPTLKAFLQGEQYLRRTEWDSALAHYEHAVALDSTFAPALRGAGIALAWSSSGSSAVGMAMAYALRAGSHNHGLPPRDSLLVVIDSLHHSLGEPDLLVLPVDSTWEPRVRRLFATVDHATSRYPHDPEMWFTRGEMVTHMGAYVGRSSDEAMQAFDRAIALDPTYAPSYLHPMEHAAADGADAMRRYLRPYLALEAKDQNAEGGRLVERLLGPPPATGAETARLLEGVSYGGLYSAFISLSRLPDSAEASVAVMRLIAAHSGSQAHTDSVTLARRLGRVLMSRGHLREGSRVVGQTRRDLLDLSEGPNPLFAEAALLRAVPAETVAAVLETRWTDPVAWVRALPWYAGRRDTTSLRTAERRADSLARSYAPSDRMGRRSWRYVRASAAAYLTLARGDSASALEQFLALPDNFCPTCYLDRFTLAYLLIEQRRDQEAWRMLEGPYPPFHWPGPLPSEILWVLMRGRAAERIGEPERAVRSYAWVAGMWRNADPELQRYVAEAREGLARLAR